MKKLLIGVVAIALLLSGCNSKNREARDAAVAAIRAIEKNTAGGTDLASYRTNVDNALVASLNYSAAGGGEDSDEILSALADYKMALDLWVCDRHQDFERFECRDAALKPIMEKHPDIAAKINAVVAGAQPPISLKVNHASIISLIWTEAEKTTAAID